MNIFKKAADQIKKKALDVSIRGSNKVLVDAGELADLRIAASAAKAGQREPVVPMSKEHLTMKQLGSYVPNFVALANKTDDFKNSLGLVCRNLMQTEEWKYLIAHLEQDQVNISLFTEGVKHTDDWVRGSINGIYVVEDMVATLGRNYEQRLKEGGIGATAPKQ